MKRHRCSKCKHFHWAEDVHIVDCPGCDYKAIRCMDCGGAQGAARALVGHTTFYRGHMKWGHDSLTLTLRQIVRETLQKLRAKELRRQKAA